MVDTFGTFAERVDLESDHAAVGTADLLRRQIDCDRGVGAALGVVDEVLEVGSRHFDGEHAASVVVMRARPPGNWRLSSVTVRVVNFCLGVPSGLSFR
jgi:hypothetical protein